MKLPQDKTLLAQAAVSIVGFIAFAVVGIVALMYNNTKVVIAAVGGMATIYAHWVSSPSQQSSITSLIQQLSPAVTSLLAQQTPVNDATQPMRTEQKDQTTT